MAARRAKLVQRSSFRGLQGNPDACHPGRGSACYKTAWKTCGNADPVFALSVQPTAAMSPRFGGSGGEAPDPSFPPFLREEMGAPAAQARPARGHPGVGTREPLIRLAFGHPPSPRWGEGFGRMISAPAGPAMVSRTRY